MAYLLDANVFIQAKNLHYGFDFCPAFWDWIDERHAVGSVFSIEKVGDELVAVDDELTEWARQRTASFFLKPDAPVIPSLQATSAWANGAGYEPVAVSTSSKSPTRTSSLRPTPMATSSSPKRSPPTPRRRSRSRTPASAWA